MTKIRCQVCGGEDLYSVDCMTIVCRDCGNRSFVIPESAISEMCIQDDEDHMVLDCTLSMMDNPRRSICLNDKMNPDAEPCAMCKVVRKRFNDITQDMLALYEKRQQMIREHPDLEKG